MPGSEGGAASPRLRALRVPGVRLAPLGLSPVISTPMRKLLWFLALYAAGVLVVVAVAGGIKLMLR
jgi:hypothetical protein